MVPQFDPVWGIRVHPWGGKWYQSKSGPTSLLDFYIHYKPILRRFLAMHNSYKQSEECVKAWDCGVMP